MIGTVNRKLRVIGIWEAFEKKFQGRYYFKDFLECFFRLIYVMDGNVFWQNGEEKIYLRTGEVAVRKGNEVSYAESISLKTAKILVISLDITGMLTKSVTSAPQSLSVKSVEKLNGVIEVLKEHGNTPEDFLDCNKSTYLHELANNIENFFLTFTEDKTEYFDEKIRLSNEFKEIVEIMRQNVERPLGVKNIAELCGMSESSLKKIFSKYSACSIHKYFLKMKIFKAIELLDNNYNVAEISEMLSFNNQNYFGVVFKKETGYSPLNYRKKFLRK